MADSDIRPRRSARPAPPGAASRDETRRARAAALADPALVAAMRREDDAAVAEFFARFTPLLEARGRAWGMAAAEREELAADVLADVALHLLQPTTAVPASLAAYLLTALRHRLARLARERRTAPDGAAHPGPDGAGGAHAVTREAGLALCSDYARVACLGPAAQCVGTAPALDALARHLDAGLRDDDRRLLVWLAHHVPLRTVAGWLDVRYETAVKRAQRLRTRLRVAAEAYVATLSADDRRVVDALLRRADAAPAPPITTTPRAAPGAEDSPR